jgi:hypothetical protein
VGGAVGLAAVSAVAASSTSGYVHTHAVLASSAPALDHGFQTALYVLVGVLVAGAAVAAGFVRPAPAREVAVEEAILFEEAA